MYNIEKKIELFINLVDSIWQHFPGLEIPNLPDVFYADDEEREMLRENNAYITEYTDELLNLMNFFSRSPVVRESIFFKKFLEIDKNFPDEISNNRNKMNRRVGPVSRATIGAPAPASNIDLMSDGFSDKFLSPKQPSNQANKSNRVRENRNTFSPNTGAEVDTDDDEEWNTEEKTIEDFVEWPNTN